MSADAEFVDGLRGVTERYLGAIDAWEEAYAKYYRLSGSSRVSSDLEPFHNAYLDARREFSAFLPRARRLCRKHEIRDLLPALLHINLGTRSPQTGQTGAIGRAERVQIMQCLTDLEAAIRLPASIKDERPTGFLRRIFEFFF
jgi:hypothetical protein